MTDSPGRIAQLTVMSDPERLVLLGRVLLEPDGDPRLSDLVRPGESPSRIAHHLESMTAVGLLARLGQGEVATYRATVDALVRFGGAALAGEVATTVPAEVRSHHDPVLRRIAGELAEAHAAALSRESVEAFVRECYELLAARARIHQHLPALTARFAAERLRGIVADQASGRTVLDALFVCVRNTGRSQIAAALMRERGGPLVSVGTAGSKPAAWVDERVRHELNKRGLDRLIDFPRPLTPDLVRSARVVVTMGCGEACPVLPGRRYEDWRIPDPVGQPAHVIAEIIDAISARVDSLVDELPAAR